MTEPTIICPNCKAEIKLTESLAAPLIESTRRQYEQRLAKQNVDIAEREKALTKATEALDEQVAEKVKQERAKIVTEELGTQSRTRCAGRVLAADLARQVLPGLRL